jgi:hypothetical protein
MQLNISSVDVPKLKLQWGGRNVLSKEVRQFQEVTLLQDSDIGLHFVVMSTTWIVFVRGTQLMKIVRKIPEWLEFDSYTPVAFEAKYGCTKVEYVTHYHKLKSFYNTLTQAYL